MAVLCPVTVIGHEHSTSEGLLYQRRSIYRHHIDRPQEFSLEVRYGTTPGDGAPKKHDARYLPPERSSAVDDTGRRDVPTHCYATRIQLVYLDRKMMDLALG
jgi:hypothetical protein